MKNAILVYVILCGMAFGYGFDNNTDQSMYGGFGGYQYKPDVYNSNNNAYDNYNNSFDKYESYYNQRQNRDENEYKYKGASGQEYQYNLSDPMDKLNYDLDLKAKMNDELYAPITPNVDLDRGLGQYGGGIKPLFE